MTDKKYKIIIAVLAVVVALLSVRIIFDSKFDDFDRYIHARKNYEGGAEKFDKDFQGLIEWEKNYKKDNPGVTDKEIDEAFKDAWKE